LPIAFCRHTTKHSCGPTTTENSSRKEVATMVISLFALPSLLVVLFDSNRSCW